MTGLQTSAESPVPVRTVARLIGQWVSRLGRVWVEGQVTEVSRRPGAGTVFLTLRDPVADVSLRLTCSRGVCDAVAPPLADGARVVVHAKPEFYLARGTLTLAATEIRPLGVGALLARLEQLKSVLHAEGLFDPARKRPLPFLPRVVGLVCGRASAAERDVLEVARARWPAVRFDVREVAVQGHLAVEQVGSALRALEAEPEVDVVVVARGGGSVEDLLPFSDEALVRLVAALRTPVVSAIGHEPDVPLLDLVADVRASTPTDAARRVVPDVTEELARVGALSERLRRAVRHRLDVEQRALDGLRGRPALAEPLREVERREAEVTQLRDRAGRAALGALHRAEDDLAHSLARVRALSPQATLDRGYAVVQHAAGPVVVEPADVMLGELLRVRVAGGRFTARAAADSGSSGGSASSVRT